QPAQDASASFCCLLRSAHAGGLSQTRTGVRASRRMRTPPHASRTGPSCFETAASPPPQHEVLSMRKDSALDGSSGAKRITIARAGRPAKPGLWLFPVFVLFRPVIEGPNRATDATPPARISRLRPAAYGQRRGAGLWPAACFFAVIYREI